MDYSKFSNQQLIELLKDKQNKLQLIENDKWTNTINSLDDILLIIDTNYFIEEINESGLNFLKKSKNEVIGKKCHLILFNEEKPSEKCPIRGTKKTINTDRYLTVFDRFFSVKSSPVFNENGKVVKYIDILRDITEIENINFENKKAKSSLNKAENIAQIGHWEFHLDKNIVVASEGAKKIYGYPPEKKTLTISEIQNIPTKEYRELLDKALSDLINNNKKYDLEFKISRVSDGEIIDIHSVAEYLPDKKLVFGIIKDITVQKRAKELLKFQNEEYAALNEEYSSQNEQLKKALLKVEHSDNLKTAFINNISHEFRTPMNAILGFSDLLISKTINEKNKEYYAEILKKSCNKLLEIVDDTIEISKIHSKTVEIHLTTINLSLFLNNIISYYQHEATSKGLNFISDFYFTNEFTIITDEDKLYKILKHVLNNSFKFTHFGAVTLKVTVDDENLIITILDTGIGIPEKNIDKIFEAFTQIENGYTRNFGGNGNGLTIAKSYVELLGGKISVKSKIDSGTVVNIIIPVKKTQLNKKLLHKKTQPYNWSKKTILIAEDEHLNYMFLEEILKNTCANIIHAKNGVQAVELFKNNRIDLVLMDIKMPLKDGFYANEQIKMINKKTPVIAQTAYVSDTDVKKIFSSNFDDLITKPIKPQKIIDLISKYFYEK
ncbi:MAG: response regulator [Bacteroidales bacterium]|nr:response regulator [Bacteroidales bacterium]